MTPGIVIAIGCTGFACLAVGLLGMLQDRRERRAARYVPRHAAATPPSRVQWHRQITAGWGSPRPLPLWTLDRRAVTL